MRKLLLIPIFLIIVTAVAGGVYLKTRPVAQVAPVKHEDPIPQVPTYPIPPEIQPALTALGVDQKQASEIQFHYGTTGPCQGKEYWACSRGNEIWVLNVNSPRINQYVGHEYMHIMWFKLPNQGQVEADLQTVYNSNAALRQRLTFYDPASIPRELFPIECTEVSDSELPPTLRASCAHYLPNRSALPSDF